MACEVVPWSSYIVLLRAMQWTQQLPADYRTSLVECAPLGLTCTDMDFVALL